MEIAYKLVLGLAIAVSIAFTVLILVTAKGDAMSSGGGQIRTTYKGKASFDDQIGKVTLYMGASFMLMMIVLDFLGHRINQK